MTKVSLENEKSTSAYFIVSGVSVTDSKHLSKTISHWSRYHGTEWCVARLKDLKMQRINYANSDSSTFVKSHKDSTPYGSLRRLWSVYTLDIAIRCLGIYTTQISQKITTIQAEKFCKAVNYYDSNGYNYIPSVTTQPVVCDLKRSHLLNWVNSKQKRAPFAYGKSVVGKRQVSTKVESSMKPSELLEDFMSASSGNVLICRKYRNLIMDALDMSATTFDDVELKVTFYNYRAQLSYNNAEYEHVVLAGKIGLIQERGLKLRCVANPFRILQFLLEPLGKILYRCLQRLPSDCTFDQEKSIDFIQDKLRRGDTMHSFDLSNATDMFPFSTQQATVSKLIKSLTHHIVDGEKVKLTASDRNLLIEQINMLTHIARAKWYAPELSFVNESSDFLSWKTGQPLGVYPSFAMFALTHNLLLLSIEKEVKVHDTFRVLGDDVIISNSKVAHKYSLLMERLNCPISCHKSLTSKLFGEFGGKLVSKEKVYFFPKFQPFSFKNPLGPLRSLNGKGLHLVPKQFQKRVAYWASIPKPYGLGINPLGISLSSRMRGNEELWQADRRPQPLVSESLSTEDKAFGYIDGVWSKLGSEINPRDEWSIQPDHVGAYLEDNVQLSPYDIRSLEHFNAVVSSQDRSDTSIPIMPPFKTVAPRNRRQGYEHVVTDSFTKLNKLFKPETVSKCGPA